jgi:hypothetical protein
VEKARGANFVSRSCEPGTFSRRLQYISAEISLVCYSVETWMGTYEVVGRPLRRIVWTLSVSWLQTQKAGHTVLFAHRYQLCQDQTARPCCFAHSSSLSCNSSSLAKMMEMKDFLPAASADLRSHTKIASRDWNFRVESGTRKVQQVTDSQSGPLSTFGG